MIHFRLLKMKLTELPKIIIIIKQSGKCFHEGTFSELDIKKQ